MRATFKILRAALHARAPVMLENPINSMIWIVPSLQKLLSLGAEVITCDQCQFKAPWRKRTRLALWNCVSKHGLNCRCSGHSGVCSASKKHHIILQGTAPCGRAWTSLAQHYPKPFAHEIGRVLCVSADELMMANLRSLAL